MEKFLVCKCLAKKCGFEFITNDNKANSCPSCASKELKIEQKLGFIFKDLNINEVDEEMKDDLEEACEELQEEFVEKEADMSEVIRTWFIEKNLLIPKEIYLDMDIDWQSSNLSCEYLRGVTVKYDDYVNLDLRCTEKDLANLRDFISDNYTISEMKENDIIEL